jgi:hypothetical protein
LVHNILEPMLWRPSRKQSKTTMVPKNRNKYFINSDCYSDFLK